MTIATRQPTLSAQCTAEFLGTALMIFFGTGCVAALKVAGASFGLWEICIIWGMAVSMGIYLSAGISGAHLNPAVSIALSMFAGFEKRKLPFYIASQIAGAFCGAGLVYLLYVSLFFDFEHAHHIIRGTEQSLDLASVFSTYPNPAISVGQAFLVEMVITTILMGVIMALGDDNNGLPRGALAPLLIGLLVAVIGSAMGPLTGFAMNPARDFGPKMMTFIAGWGEIAFTGGRDIPYFLVPIFAPILGACLGAAGYRVLIGRHLPGADPAVDEKEKKDISAVRGKAQASS
ncbi:MIP/aquaporin family protein [Pseudomonas alliivorans]|uniref:MIP/aquaporin family protein n=1 Tax=Pseudomonas fragariae (ex Marin et al. 2024) TaxID=3080056 RepID=UPI002ED3AE59|nr:MIP/aquaporin family protein [Pseudomonas alliivorans]MEE4792248.1 MIP/aquaporin family protein [Pseudomonas alliivorans]MEE4796649.1 MIP/aquaporin family protein [Pseudomonas alliivorans]MEE4806487.1 MIP/aquaporin family protein [Pseudomonas alliivorans]MEE4821952.1 MIP/aquaporin family protein [Pseudomonas alliivorans]